MAVAINTIGTLDEGTAVASGATTATITVPTALSNTALVAVVSVNGTSTTAPGTISVSGVAGLTQIGSTITTGGSHLLALAAFAVLGITSGVKTVTPAWTGAGSVFDLEVYLLALTGVDQGSFATSFTHATTLDATGTNPQLSFVVSNGGLGIASFSASGAGDITDVTVGGSSVAIAGTHGNFHSINWNSGSDAGTGASLTFQGTEGTSQENIGLGFNVVPVGGAGGAHCQSRSLLGVGCGIWLAKKIEQNPRVSRRDLLVPRRSLLVPQRKIGLWAPRKAA